MKLKLGNDDIFQCPEGRFTATLELADEPNKRINRGCAKQIRLRFRVKTPDGKEYLVGKTYCADLAYGSELYNDLESWLDGSFDSVLDENQEIDLDLFINKKADVLITHFNDGKHDKPFVKIAGIFPAGRLTQP